MAVGSGSPVVYYTAVTDDYFGVDNTAPVSTVDPIANQTPSTNFSVSGTASDATSGLVAGKVHVSLRRASAPSGELTSADRSVSGGTWSWGPGGQVAGTYCVDSLATDIAGNAQPSPGEQCFSIGVVDTTPPSVSMSSAAGNPTNTSPIPVSVTFSEAVTG